jgi:GNAT superfamily N-acetyltransferase
VAALHADSWRRHYRGAYSDAFLDGDVAIDRLEVWTARFGSPGVCARTILAESGTVLIGFAHVVPDADATWGALLDNLHVAQEDTRRGFGTRLMARAAEVVLERTPSTGLYLWVLEQNTGAQRFYEACGGRRVERALTEPPGGVPGRLNGSPAKLRYMWPDPSVLVC